MRVSWGAAPFEPGPLDGVVDKFTRLGMPRISAVVLVFILFMTFLVFALFWLMPRLSSQVTQLVQQLPVMLAQGSDSHIVNTASIAGLVTGGEITSYSVTKFGVPAENVVATIDIPRSHQGMPRPARKKSASLRLPRR